MKRSNVAILLSMLALALASASASAQKESKSNPLSGSWDCVAHGSVEGDVAFTLSLAQDQENLTGSISTADGDLTITSGSYKDGAIQIVLNAPDAKYTVNGKFDGDKLSGQWSKEGDDGKQGGPWEGKRSATAPAASASTKQTQ